MKSIGFLVIFSILVLSYPSHDAEAFNPKEDTITPHTFTNLKQMLQDSDIIGYGNLDGVKQQFPTQKTVSRGKLVNSVQRFVINKTYKGNKTIINLLITGVEPLPRPRDPINEKYPGPLASGSYVLFLKKINGTNYYQLSGGWQGVYPILNNQSVALYGIGFQSLNGLTVNQFFKRLASTSY